MENKRKAGLWALVLTAAVGMISLTGLTFSQASPTSAKPALAVEQLSSVQEGAPPLSALRPGEYSRRTCSFENTGTAPCKVRLRLCVPQVDEKDLYLPGILEGGSFTPAGEGGSTNKAYWQRRGEYIYYRNDNTKDLLPPGRETPPLYNAVRCESPLPDIFSAESAALFLEVEIAEEDPFAG